MKKQNSLFALSTTILLSLVSVSCSSKPITKVAVEMAIVSDSLTTEYFEYNFDLESYTKQSNEPNDDIALMGLLFSANIATSAMVKFENSEFLPENYGDYASFYKHLQLDDYVTTNVGFDEENDPYDQSVLNLSHKEITINDKTYDIGLFTVIDSGGGVQWISNFDVGSDIDAYTTMTGEHPEWTDHLAHKGFDISSNRCLSYIEEYISIKMDKDAEQLIYVFGHSRGGAVGNLLSKKMIDKGYNTTAYLFAGPDVTTRDDVNDNKYSKIFNFINTRDLITQILPKNWGLQKYGQVFEYDATEYKDIFKKINGMAMPTGNNKIIVNALAKLANKREDLYTIDDKFTIATANNIPDVEGVKAFFESYANMLTGDFESLRIYISGSLVKNDDDTYNCKLRTCPALLTNLIGKVVASFKEVSDIVPEIRKYMTFLKPFMDVAELKTTDLITLASMFKYVGAMHYYYSYLTFFIK